MKMDRGREAAAAGPGGVDDDWRKGGPMREEERRNPEERETSRAYRLQVKRATPEYFEKAMGNSVRTLEKISHPLRKPNLGGTVDSSPETENEKKEPIVRIREDPNRNFPTFHFFGRLKKKLYRAWRKAVIVKLLDHHVGYKALEARLQALWAKRGVINLINIGYGFFVVKLSNREDYFNALTGGPWMLYDHYLTVRPWEPRFNPAKEKIDKVAVWVRLPRVSLEYYDEEALTIIGNRIGETIKVDMNTSCQLRGHYARMCVLVDLGKQLMSGFSLDGEDYYLEYEGLHSLCTNCSVYGHNRSVCPSRRKETEIPEAANGDRFSQGNVNLNNPIGNVDSNSNEQEQWRVVQKPH
ncbi:uncharacterized protein LOC114719495 [Neltuma alba]|uniref:uncharacterized protein LOC114719495 n=1 Tax=Neltuma alba TaxID=207710 RepID=UPI0010A4D054|nr:uncharacterized protein LOC114719495 [Prosopis alba]